MALSRGVYANPVRLAYSDTGTNEVCLLPAGAVPLRASILVTEAFNDSTSLTIQFGKYGATTDYSAAVQLVGEAVNALVHVPFAKSEEYDNQTAVTATLTAGTGDATAGTALVFVDFLHPFKKG